MGMLFFFIIGFLDTKITQFSRFFLFFSTSGHYFANKERDHVPREKIERKHIFRWFIFSLQGPLDTRITLKMANFPGFSKFSLRAGIILQNKERDHIPREKLSGKSYRYNFCPLSYQFAHSDRKNFKKVQNELGRPLNRHKND